MNLLEKLFITICVAWTIKDISFWVRDKVEEYKKNR